jgi:hypothetical protein
MELYLIKYFSKLLFLNFIFFFKLDFLNGSLRLLFVKLFIRLFLVNVCLNVYLKGEAVILFLILIHTSIIKENTKFLRFI